MASNIAGDRFAGRTNQTDAVEDQGIAGQYKKKQNALEHFGEILRHLDRDLGIFAADEGKGEKQARDQDSDWIEPAEEGDDDRREAVARRDVGLQISDRSRNLDDTG